jgi:hypothetical protein
MQFEYSSPNTKHEHEYYQGSMRWRSRRLAASRHQRKNLESKLSKALGMPVSKGDLWLLGLLIAGLTFIGMRHPETVVVYLITCLIALCAKMIADYTPAIGAVVGAHIKVHHVTASILLCTMVFSTIGMPAQALLFEAIETQVNEILTGAGSTIDPATITLVFTVLRIIVIFGFLVGGIFLVNQAMQGGDWKPIGNMMAIGVGFVLAIEVLSNLVLGAGGGGAGGT